MNHGDFQEEIYYSILATEALLENSKDFYGVKVQKDKAQRSYFMANLLFEKALLLLRNLLDNRDTRRQSATLTELIRYRKPKLKLPEVSKLITLLEKAQRVFDSGDLQDIVDKLIAHREKKYSGEPLMILFVPYNKKIRLNASEVLSIIKKIWILQSHSYSWGKNDYYSKNLAFLNKVKKILNT